MKYLLSLCSVITFGGSSLSALTINRTINQSNNVVNNTKTIKQDELPIPNVGNWDLSTAKGYFKYLGYVFQYHNGYKKYYSINVSNDGNGSQNYYDDNWDNNKIDYVGNNGFMKESVTNHDKSLLDASKDILTNYNQQPQTEYSSGYSHSVQKGKSITLGTKISTEVDVSCFVENTKFTAEISTSGTWSTLTTDTFTAPPQPVNMPAESQVEVDYTLYSVSSSLVDAGIYRQLNNNQKIAVNIKVGYNDPVVYWYNWIWTYQQWVNWIQQQNLTWLLHIQNAYLTQTSEGLFGRAYSAHYEGLGSEYHVTIGKSHPIS